MAWDAAVAAWLRAALNPMPEQLRADIDRLVTEALIPERARARHETVDAVRAEWNEIKDRWTSR
jgi:hypothetical protein